MKLNSLVDQLAFSFWRDDNLIRCNFCVRNYYEFIVRSAEYGIKHLDFFNYSLRSGRVDRITD